MSECIELPIVFNCEGQDLIGIIHNPTAKSQVGVLIVVGGPQYRVGSHRQFILLARYLAKAGLSVMRFDYRGMGDSMGEMRDFNNIDEDIYRAIDTFQSTNANVKEIIIWGLCDAASAALFYTHKDNRVTGLVLLNPWVRTDYGEASAYLNKYYKNRLISLDFWKKIMMCRFDIMKSIKSFADILIKAFVTKNNKQDHLSLPDRMLQGLCNYNGEILIILSGNDLTAEEFSNLMKNSDNWKFELASKLVTFKKIADANHTFSSQKWRSEVEDMTLDWLTRHKTHCLASSP